MLALGRRSRRGPVSVACTGTAWSAAGACPAISGSVGGRLGRLVGGRGVLRGGIALGFGRVLGRRGAAAGVAAHGDQVVGDAQLLVPAGAADHPVMPEIRKSVV